MEIGQLPDYEMPEEPGAAAPETDTLAAAKQALQDAMRLLPGESAEACAARIASARHAFGEALALHNSTQPAADYKLPPDTNS